jgi:hypothetical protein
MIKDFIGVFEKSLGNDLCDYYANHFEKMKSAGFSYRRSPEETASLSKSDEAANLFRSESLTMMMLGMGNPKSRNSMLMQSIWNGYKLYSEAYSGLSKYPQHSVVEIKIQKTLPTEGYHVWHCEDAGLTNSNRILAWMIYLNDVKEGGETEFLYQSMRVAPKKGTLVIWPAGFSHMHRGNPPLSGEKYIMTGWFQYV